MGMSDVDHPDHHEDVIHNQEQKDQEHAIETIPQGNSASSVGGEPADRSVR
jgi:hypothetical protein